MDHPRETQDAWRCAICRDLSDLGGLNGPELVTVSHPTVADIELGYCGQGIKGAFGVAILVQDENAVIGIHAADIGAYRRLNCDTDMKGVPSIFFQEVALERDETMHVINAILVNKPGGRVAKLAARFSIPPVIAFYIVRHKGSDFRNGIQAGRDLLEGKPLPCTGVCRARAHIGRADHERAGYGRAGHVRGCGSARPQKNSYEENTELSVHGISCKQPHDNRGKRFATHSCSFQRTVMGVENLRWFFFHLGTLPEQRTFQPEVQGR